MKRMKKVFAFLLTMVMVLAMAVPAMAQTVGEASDGPGSISISNPTKGQTYSIYKLFDATVASDNTIAYTGTIPETLKEVFEYVSGTTNNIQVKSTAVDSDGNFTADATKKVTDYVNTLSPATASIDSNGTSPLTFQGLSYGYYAVKSNLGTVLSVDSTNPAVTVRDKNTTNPGTDAAKKIVTTTTSEDGTTTTTSVSATTAKIGDVVDYQITFTAQNYDSNNEFVYQYVITDTPTGIDIDTSTLQYSIVKGTGQNQYNETEHGASVAKDDNGSVTITIPWGNQNKNLSYYDTPATVTVTYSAKLTAITGSNKANVTYNTQQSGTDTDEPKVYTAELDLTKVAKDSKQNDGSYTTKLSGAEFELYDADGTTRIYVTQGTDGTYTVTDTANEVKIVSGSDGTFKIAGLKQGVAYQLKETKAPDGYTLPSSNITLKASTTSTIGNVTASENVENTKGTELPSTGGIGTTLFYVIGAICVLGAGVLLVTRRRMASK